MRGAGHLAESARGAASGWAPEAANCGEASSTTPALGEVALRGLIEDMVVCPGSMCEEGGRADNTPGALADEGERVVDDVALRAGAGAEGEGGEVREEEGATGFIRDDVLSTAE